MEEDICDRSSEEQSQSNDDVTIQESKIARFVTEYEMMTSLSMFLSSYLGGLLLKFYSVR